MKLLHIDLSEQSWTAEVEVDEVGEAEGESEGFNMTFLRVGFNLPLLSSYTSILHVETQGESER